MKTFSRQVRERGSIAVETAPILLLLITLFAFTLFFGRYFWYYEASQKAAHDAVRFLSTASQADMRTPAMGGAEAAVASVARSIIAEEISSVTPYVYPLYVDVHCDFRTCGNGVPTTVRVSISMRLKDNIFGPLTSAFFGEDGILMVADVTMRYVGT
jgi:Flp pilus assembly protein TadG